MTAARVFLAMILASGLTACATAPVSNTPARVELTNVVSTSAETPNVAAAPTTTTQKGWHVEDVRVWVPSDLKVSEANLYMPKADIVWREDPFGDRRAQVSAIIDDATTAAVAGLEGGEGVFIDIKVERFHALTQKAHASIGGTHDISFSVTIRDANTEAELVAPFPVHIVLKAPGGQKAIEAEMRGETQKVVISRGITETMRKYLGT